MVSNIEDFGSDRFTYLAGDDTRYQTGRVRTVLPHPAETNAGFQERMHLMARQLFGMGGVASVSMDFDRIDGSIVKATVTIVEAPRPAPIAPDTRPAGGRWTARGGRGGGR